MVRYLPPKMDRAASRAQTIPHIWPLPPSNAAANPTAPPISQATRPNSYPIPMAIPFHTHAPTTATPAATAIANRPADSCLLVMVTVLLPLSRGEALVCCEGKVLPCAGGAPACRETAVSSRRGDATAAAPGIFSKNTPHSRHCRAGGWVAWHLGHSMVFVAVVLHYDFAMRVGYIDIVRLERIPKR